jgi:hypothetical protein
MMTLRAINPKLIDPNPPLDMLQTTKNELHVSNMPDAMLPAYPITDKAEVDMTCSIMLLDSKKKKLEEHPAGQLMLPTNSAFASKISWQYGYSNSTTTCQLAPAFAGITATWLDRNAISAITTAANWLGSTRTAEVEPATKTALRTCAAAPIDMTAIYVRLWALYYSAVQANVRGEAYAPETRTSRPHVIYATSAYHDWAAAINATVACQHNGIFFDAQSTVMVDDVLPVLELATGPPPRYGGMAQWLWPQELNIVLYTNATRATHYGHSLNHWAIEACINWLALSTDTAQQSTYAQGLVMALAYRPRGYALLGPSGVADATTITLPRLSTAGQLLLPLSLWATTADPRDCGPTPETSVAATLRRAAVASLCYVYSLGQSLNEHATPNWWPNDLKQMYQERSHRALGISGAGWLPALAASHLRHQLQLHISIPATHHVRPTHLRNAKALQRQIPLKATTLFSISPNPSARDSSAAMFLRTTFPDGPIMHRVGAIMAIKQVVPGMHADMAAKVLHAGGARVGLVVQSKSMGTTSAILWKPAAASDDYRTYPEAEPTWSNIIPIVYFPDADALVGTIRLAEERAAGQWYVTAPAPMMDNMSYAGQLPTPAAALPITIAHDHKPVQPLKTQPTATPPDQSDAENAKQHDGEKTDTEQDDDEQLTRPGLTPPSITQAGIYDSVVQAMIDHHDSGTRPSVTRQLAMLPSWTIPQTIAHDDEALQWIAMQLPITYTTTHYYRPQEAITAIGRNIDEQIKLNCMRRVAEVTQRARQSTDDPPDDQQPLSSPPTPNIRSSGAIDWAAEAAAADPTTGKDMGPQPEHVAVAPAAQGAVQSTDTPLISAAVGSNAPVACSTTEPAPTASELPLLHVATSL